jgi:hypothetical protein
MMKAVSIEDFKTIDLMSQPQEDGPCITVGIIATRKVPNSLGSFPDFNQFTGKLDQAKKDLRKSIFDTLKTVAQRIKSGDIESTVERTKVDDKIFDRPHTLEEFKRMWQALDMSHVIVVSADERICIYDGEKPDIEAHAFYTVPQFACLLDLMDIFGARNLLIFRKGKEKGHEI